MKFACSYLCFILLTFALAFSLNVALTNSAQAASQLKQQANAALKVKTSKQAAKIAKSRIGGKVLKVKRSNTSYRVKLIKKDGHIISVLVDARTGKVIGGK